MDFRQLIHANILNIYIEDKLGDYYLMEPTTFNMFNMNGIGNFAGSSSVTNPFSADSSMPMFDFSKLFNTGSSIPDIGNDVMASTFNMYYSFLNNPMLFFPQMKFNTQSNLPQLKDARYNSKLGNSLANIAYENATSKNSKHRCLQGVRESLNKAGLIKGTMGGSAYQAAAVLDKDKKNFSEIKVAKSDLKNLPAGCIIVWDRNYVGTSPADKNGHITITLGNGGGACDRIEDKLFMLNTAHRVFVPTGMDKSA